MTRIAVIGLGKLGAPLAAVLASEGHAVTGVDASPEVVEAINSGRAPVRETGLQDLMDSCHELCATSSYEEAIHSSDVSFIIVPTPSDDTGAFSNDYILAAIDEIGAALKGRRKYHLVVVCSTVMPGSVDGPIREALQTRADRLIGNSIGLCYSPEFIALGSVIKDMRNPDMVLIGECDEKAGDTLQEVLKTVVGEDYDDFCRMSIINAEIAKISVNAYVTMKISYANKLAEICEHIPAADAQVITNAIGLDRRIGRAYLRPGVAYGGTCFPRDAKAFNRAAELVGVSSELATATQVVNDHQVERVAKIVCSQYQRFDRIGILGLSFKPGTDVTEQSFGCALVKELQEPHTIMVYDPVVNYVEGFKNVTWAESAEDLIANCDIVILATPWPQFAGLDFQNGRTVIDCWNFFNTSEMKRSYAIRLGRGYG